MTTTMMMMISSVAAAAATDDGLHQDEHDSPTTKQILTAIFRNLNERSKHIEYYFTDEETLLPFWLPLGFFLSCWLIRTQVMKQSYIDWAPVHNFHHIVGMVMGTFSLLIQDNGVYNERVGILWTLGFFLVDILDCLVVRSYVFLLHGIVTAICGLSNYYLPLHRKLRMNSKASFIEASSIFLYQAKKTRHPLWFASFAIVFTLCRIYWIPVGIMKVLYDYKNNSNNNGGGDNDNDSDVRAINYVLVVLAVFYYLQVYWWIKIIKIIYKMTIGDKEKLDEDGNTKTTTADKGKKES